MLKGANENKQFVEMVTIILQLVQVLFVTVASGSLEI